MIELFPPGPDGGYKIILADPPWQFKVRVSAWDLQKTPDRHYDTMPMNELAALDVAAIAAKDSILAMWVYDPMLPDAIRLAAEWDFHFVTVLFRWLKGNGQGRLFDDGERLRYGLGYHTRGGGCEECWLFKRGKGLPVLRHDIRKEFYSNRREHSRKPDEVRGWLVDLYGDVPRIELFARTKSAGWAAFGNETDLFNEAVA